MLVNLQDVLFWMDAIRNSDNSKRTLESFWKGQINSKLWLIENLQPFVNKKQNNIVIHGGWNGVLSSLLFNSDIDIQKIINVDIDPSCLSVATTVNKRQEIEGRFSHIISSMEDYDYVHFTDIVINTSCEHISQPQYQQWLKNVPDESLIVLQSNNYQIEEHVRTAASLEHFVNQSHLNTILFIGQLELPLYKRFMIIGKNNNL